MDELFRQIMGLAGSNAALTQISRTPWGSVSFAGSRLKVVLAFTGEAIADADRFIAALPNHEFSVPGWIVADAGVVGIAQSGDPAHRMVVEADVLAVEEFA